MQSGLTRRAFGSLAISTLMLGGATTGGHAASAAEIDADVSATLRKLYLKVPGSRDIAIRAAGVLVFPTIVKAGFWFGGEYGEGALRIRGRTVGYFDSVSASFGLQIGVQSRSVVIMFMTPEALQNFRRKRGWKVGVDGSVAIVTIGAGGSVDTNQINHPVIAFIFDEAGLMFNLTLEGTKISPIYR